MWLFALGCGKSGADPGYGCLSRACLLEFRLQIRYLCLSVQKRLYQRVMVIDAMDYVAGVGQQFAFACSLKAAVPRLVYKPALN